MVKIKYIGKREKYVEGTYGSKIEFTKGESVLIDGKLAAKLIKHKDQYIIDDSDDAGEVKEALAEEREIEEDDYQDERDSISNLDKKGLSDFAGRNFAGTKLDGRKSVELLRTEVIGMIDRYGLD